VIVVAAVLIAGPYVAITDDTWYALVAGDQLSRFEQPYYEGVHDHPLTLLLGVLLAPLDVGTALNVLVVIGVVSFVALLYALFRLARALGGIAAGALAVSFALLSPTLQLDAFFAIIDVPFAALVLLAVALVAESPRELRWDALIALLAATLLRPEAWPLALVYGAWLAYLGVRGKRLALVAVLVAAAPVIWFMVELIVFGDALRALKVTDMQAEVFGRGGFAWPPPGSRPEGIAWLPGDLVDDIGLALKDELGFGWTLPALGLLTALWLIVFRYRKSRDRATASSAAAVAVAAIVLLATLLLIDKVVLNLENRYAIATGLVLVALASASPRLTRIRPLLLGLLILIALYLPSNLRQVGDNLEAARFTREAESDLAALTEQSEVADAVERCPALLIRATGFYRGWAQLGSLIVAVQFGQDWDEVAIRKGLAPSQRHSEFRFSPTGEWSFRSPCLAPG
jgi:hypothetical protein